LAKYGTPAGDGTVDFVGRLKPKAEGLLKEKRIRRLEAAMRRFDPDSQFIDACLARMKFKDKTLSGTEKALVLEITMCYDKKYWREILVDFIGFLSRLDSNDLDLDRMLVNSLGGSPKVDLKPFRRDYVDDDLVIWARARPAAVNPANTNAGADVQSHGKSKDIPDDDY